MLVLIAVVVVVIIIRFLWRKPEGQLPPGPKGMPIIGVATEIDMLTAHKTMTKWAETYGVMFSFKAMGVPTLVINDAKLARKAYAGEGYQDIFNDRPPTFVGKYLTFDFKDVGYAKYDDALKLRKVLHKALHFYGDGVQKFENVVRLELERFVKQLEGLGSKVVDPRPMIETSFAVLISSLLTGKHEDPTTCNDKRIMWNYLTALNKAIEPVYDTVLQSLPVLRFVPGRYRKVYLETLTSRDIVLERFYEGAKKTYQHGKERGLIDVLLRIQKEGTSEIGAGELQDDHVRGITLDALAAGMLTSLNGLLGTLLALLNHPECIAKIREEVDAVVGKDRFPGFADRADMPYTEATVLEGLRYISHLPLMPHGCSIDVQFEGYDIPKGTQVFANLWHIHHNKEVWGDPWNFRPERFLDEEGRVLGPSHIFRQWFMTFGVGRRSCVGESLAKSRIFLYIATLIQRFDVMATTSLTSDDPRTFINGGLVIEVPKFECQFVPRK